MTFLPLYKRSTTGKISYWEIIVNGDSYYTISGYTDGKHITSEPTICTPKNIGKSNETTGESQALFEAKALWQKKVDLGSFPSINQIDNDTFFKPMLAKDYEDEKNNIKFPLYSQPKLDGVRCIVKSNGMWSRNGKRFISAPHVFESLKPIFEQYPDLVIDGELYCDKLSNDFNKIISCVRKSKPEPKDLVESRKYIELWVYDCCDPEDLTFEERYFNIQNKYKLDTYQYVKILETNAIFNKHSIEDRFKDYITRGFEGQMLRIPKSYYDNKRSKNLLKHKEFKTDEFPIVAVNEGLGKLANKVGYITVKTKDNILVDCPVNGSHEYLEELWIKKDQLINQLATVRFFDKTPDLSLRFPKVIDINRFSYE